MNLQVEEVQPGWTVYGSDGQEIGTVVSADTSGIRVKKGGIRSREITVPASNVADVETGRVELSITKREAEASTD